MEEMLKRVNEEVEKASKNLNFIIPSGFIHTQEERLEMDSNNPDHSSIRIS